MEIENSKIKRSIYIFYSYFLDSKGDKHILGGIQQYVFGLIEIFHKDFDIHIIQKAEHDFHKSFNDYDVFGYKVSDKKTGKKLYQKTKEKIQPKDYLIWASDRIAFKSNHPNTISIQHGITFDFIDYQNIKFGDLIKNNFLLSIVYRLLQHKSAADYFLKAPKVVCVDYNFLNWARTILPRRLTDRAVVIPNYSKIPDNQKRQNNNQPIKILFARRFVEYRGVYILSEIIDTLSKKYSNVNFGIYGEGPLEGYLRKKFKSYGNVTISSYTADKAHETLSLYDISLIPTIGSEGTSLSLLESMACGCAPIASNVGGMTNIILDGYNGFLVNPNVKEFIEKIEDLINKPETLHFIKNNALTTVREGFSFELWEKKWKSVIFNS